jgi:hypothetical protein
MLPATIFEFIRGRGGVVGGTNAGGPRTPTGRDQSEQPTTLAGRDLSGPGPSPRPRRRSSPSRPRA